MDVYVYTYIYVSADKKYRWKMELHTTDRWTQIKFSSFPGLMERQIGFDISDYIDRFILIDITDIAKPRVIWLLKKWAQYESDDA